MTTKQEPNNSNKATPAKRVDIVSVKLVKEASILYKNRTICGPDDILELMKPFYLDTDREAFIIICLDTKNAPTAIHTVSVGSMNASIVHPREIYKAAILNQSASIILSHNHPSGDPEPSQEDREVTKRLVEAGKILGIDVLDHIIVGDNDRYYSFKERGEM